MTEVVHQMKMLASMRASDMTSLAPGMDGCIPQPPLLIGVAPDDHLVVRPDEELTERRRSEGLRERTIERHRRRGA